MNKPKFVVISLILALGRLSTPWGTDSAAAATLNTVGANNGRNDNGAGVFFDLTPNTNMEVTEFGTTSFASAGSPVTFDIWTRAGSYVGQDGSAAGWSLHESINKPSAGTVLRTALPLSIPLNLGAGQTTGVYLVGAVGGIRYTGTTGVPHQTTISDGTLTLFSDLARGGPAFSGPATSPRTFSGYVNYTPESVAPVGPLQIAGDLVVNLHAKTISQGDATLLPTWENRGRPAVGNFAQSSASLQPLFRTNVMGSDAVEFNGSTFILSEFDVPAAVHGNNSWSLETWIKNPVVSPGADDVYFQWGRRGGPDGTNAHARYADQAGVGGLNFAAISHWGPAADMSWGPDGVADPTQTPLADVWHHIAITFDGSVERIYVDGTLRNSEIKTLLINEGHAPLKFAMGGAAYGASTGGGTGVTLGLTGYIAALRMHTGALTHAQVTNNFQAGISAQVVPEPCAAALAGCALGGLLLIRRNRAA